MGLAGLILAVAFAAFTGAWVAPSLSLMTGIGFVILTAIVLHRTGVAKEMAPLAIGVAGGCLLGFVLILMGTVLGL